MSSHQKSGTGRTRRRRVQAEELATRQRNISVSEFFLQNRHLLGYDAPTKAILTTVKEAVDNALDACEDAGILPTIRVEIEARGDDVYRIAVEDNGPGIVERQVGKIFGKLLYGSRFHELRQSRGQQGLGISAAGMYGQLTTGQPMRILTRTSPKKPARELVLSIDTLRNRPKIHRKARADWTVKHGTRVELELEGRYHRGRHSVEEYLRLTALANPHLQIVFEDPEGERTTFRRVVRKLPTLPLRVKPHPHGIELGRLIAMLAETRRRRLSSFLEHELSRVGAKTAEDIIGDAGRKLTPKTNPREITRKDAGVLHRALSKVSVSAPDTSCIAPLGEEELERGLRREVRAQAYFTVSRAPAVYRGYPFAVEVGLAHGIVPGSQGAGIPVGGADTPATIVRFANRVPLQFSPGACAMTRAVTELNWKNYGLTQPTGSIPVGPLVIMVHVASVWVPFTSESKEAIAPYPEILDELHLALASCGRKLATHVRALQRERREAARLQAIERYLPHVGLALQELAELSDAQREEVTDALDQILRQTRGVSDLNSGPGEGAGTQR